VSGIGEVLDAALEVLVANPPPMIPDSARTGGRPQSEPEPLTVKG